MDFLAELKNFLDGEGRLKQYPAKLRPKLISLFYLASKLEMDKKYTEKEINRALEAWHTFADWAMLRRELFERRFVCREADGSFYWLNEEQPTLSDFGLK